MDFFICSCTQLGIGTCRSQLRVFFICLPRRARKGFFIHIIWYLIQLRSSPPSTESYKGTLYSDCQSCARATPELYFQPEDKLLAKIDPGTHLLGKWTQPIGWHGPCQPPVFGEGLGQRDMLARATRRLSYLNLQDPSLLQYGSRLTVN